MVNLLFISNSTKVDTIKNTLQPLLKVKIDVVADFDFGLKDVFEKRPATVFIQDQIAGVTGESVARHIQMLLGSGTPAFIYLHDGSSKAKPIKGLFEYLIDLSQTDVKILADIQSTLKSLLGPQWEKIFIPPKIEAVVNTDVAVTPVDSPVFADQLVDDLLSDQGNSASTSIGNRHPTTDFSVSATPVDEPFHVVSSPQDQLAEMMSENKREPNKIQTATVRADEVFTNPPPSVPLPETASIPGGQQRVLPKQAEVLASEAVPVVQPLPASIKIGPDITVSSTSKDGGAVAPTSLSIPTMTPLQQTSAANFIINGEHPDDDVAPEELLRVFEGNCYQYSGGWKRYASFGIVVAMCAIGGIWYLLKQKPHLLTFLYRPAAQTVVVPATLTIAPKIVAPTPVSRPAQKAEVPTLPSFIPQAGLDTSFTSQKPGWERYVDETLDFRLYRNTGKIKALQVLGVKSHDISETKLKSILIELLGDGEYQIKSNEQKRDFIVSRATVGQKSDLLIYRKKAAIRAFVVSFD
jgi:flagellar FliL protein